MRVNFPFKFILIFVLVFIAGDRLFAHIAGIAFKYSCLPEAKMYSGRGKADVLVFGDSRGYRHFPVMSLEKGFKWRFKISNLSLIGASIEGMEARLLDYIEFYGLPKMVIIESTSSLSSYNEAFKEQRCFMLYSKRIGRIIKNDYPVLYYAGKVSNLFNYNSVTFFNALHKIVKPEPELTFKGVIPEKKAANVQKRARSFYKITDNNRKALKRIVELSRKKGFELRIVLTPLLPKYSDYKQWKKSLEGIIGKDVSLWEYVSNNSFVREHFYDDNHLNKDGVKVLLKILEQDGFFRQGRRT
jgi:hypothetical protein